jgi:hypothetical protein
MKYIISEGRLDKIMTSYLDSFLATKQSWSYDDSCSDRRSRILEVRTTPNWTEHMYYDFDDEDLWVSDQFIEGFSNLFGKEYLKNPSAFIKDWFYSTVDIDQD